MLRDLEGHVGIARHHEHLPRTQVILRIHLPSPSARGIADKESGRGVLVIEFHSPRERITLLGPGHFSWIQEAAQRNQNLRREEQSEGNKDENASSKRRCCS